MYAPNVVLIREHVGQVLSDCEDVPGCELAEAVANVIRAFPFEDATDLNFLVLMELGEKVVGPVLLQNKSCVFRFGYAEREYFHQVKVAKYYLKNHFNV